MGELERKVGQLLVVGVPGARADEEFIDELEVWGAGGLIFFSRHLGRLPTFSDELQRLVRACTVKPLCAIDHEGGPVLRFGSELSELPSAMAMAAAGTPVQAGMACEDAARELSALGFTVNFAPVADINDPDNPGIGIRSFGETAEMVGKYVAQVVEGFQRGGVLATAKHFPGKGSAMQDAHVSSPTVDVSKDILMERELRPFKAAIGAGVSMVMTSHVLYPQLDPHNAATFSSIIVDDLLRKELGFEGLIVTDDLEMGGSIEHETPPRAALEALLAGHDLALICHTFEAQCEARRLIRDAIRDGRLPESAVDERLERLERARGRIAHFSAGRAVIPDLTTTSTLIDELACGALCRLEGGEEVLPVQGTPSWKGAVLYVPDLGVVGPGVDDRGGGASALITTLSDAMSGLRVRRFSRKGIPLGKWNPDEDARPTPAIFCSLNAHLEPAQAELLRRVHLASEGATILVALRNPYDLELLEPGPSVARIATLGYRSNILKALAELLLGRCVPTGRLPVVLRGGNRSTTG